MEEWSWRQYDSAHGGEHAETNSEESEQSRYAPIQARLAQEEQQREVNEDTILWHNESLAGWQTRGKGYAICPYISRLRHLAKVAEDVKTSRRARLAAERLHTSAQESCAEMYPRLCHKTKVRIGCYGDPEAVEATVFMSLYSASYYGGHQGGDYIFRHLPDEPEDDTEPTSLSLSEELESVRFTLNVNDEEAGLKRSFVYCGQVPRPPREYLERLKVVSRDIMQLLSGIFSEFPDVTSAQMEIFQPGRRVSGPVFGKLCSAYRSVIQTADRKAVERVRGKLRDCPRVLEFAHLLHKLSAAEMPQVTYYMWPLIKALEEATGWTFFEMIDAADLEAARKATRLLLHEKRLERILLFQTREDENTSVSLLFFLSARWRWGEIEWRYERGAGSMRVLVGTGFIRIPTSGQLNHSR